jgi:hypothetical protein
MSIVSKRVSARQPGVLPRASRLPSDAVAG